MDGSSFNVIVFSKDRAMQLELLIHTFKKYIANSNTYVIKVLYTYSDAKFKQGYERLKYMYRDVEYIEELFFRHDLLGMFKDVPYTVFFVDDNIFKSKVDLFDSQMDVFDSNPSILCRSLRLGYNLNYCYPANISMTPPVFNEDGVFNWVGLKGDYGYPMSVDGHIFRTKEIYTVISYADFQCPNTMEGSIQGELIDKQLMVCYEYSKIFNNPINRVQQFNDNKCGVITSDFLNNNFLKGYRINALPYDELNNVSCHQEMPIIFEKCTV